MSRPLRSLLLMLTLPLLAGVAQAQWKWRDANGNVQYSDRPPPMGVPEKDILQRPPGRAPVTVRVLNPAASAPEASDAPASAPSRAEQEQRARQRQQEQEQIAQAKEADKRNAAQRAENCKNARNHMQLLESGVRVTRSNDKGEAIVLNEQQRAEEMQRARSVAANDCR